VAWGQAAFLAGLAVCAALSPHVVARRSEVGISNFGVQWRTVVPYSIAFVASVTGLGRAARRVRPPYAGVFAACAALYGAALVTTYPYHLDAALKDLHDAVGVAVFVVSAAVGVLALRLEGRLAPVVAVHLAGFVVGAVTFAGVWHLLLVAQLATGAAFSAEAVVLAARTDRRAAR
jgi:hypothetical protein